MKRLTTDDEKSTVLHLNIFYAKNGEVWVRGGGPYPDYQDVTLVQWIRAAAQKHRLNLTAEDPENLGDEMYDAIQDGDETIEGIMALLHAAAVQATEMRERLKPIEDIMGDDYDLDRLRELVEADRDGMCMVAPCVTGDTVYFLDTDGSIQNETVLKSGFSGETWSIGFGLADVGKTVFLNREAAEQALREMER